MADINLLPAEELSEESFDNVRRKLLLGSIIGLVVAGVLTTGLLIYHFSLSATRSKLISQVQENSQGIESLKASEELIVVTKGKVEEADKTLKDRLNIADFLREFAALVPQNLYFSDVKIADGKLSAVGKAKTSNEVASFISGLVSARGASIVSDVNVDSLSSNEEGSYNFVVNMKVVEGSKSE